MLIAGFPAGPWGTNCYVVATGPGTECVVDRPGQGRADGVARWSASTGSSRSRCCSPTATSTTCGPSPRSPARTTPPPRSTPTTGTCSPTRWPACPPETAAMLLGGKLRVRRARRRRGARPTARRLELAGLEFVVDHTPGHTAGSVTFRTPYDEQDVLRGDVLRRPALRRLHRPHRPARRRPPDDAAQPARRRCCRCATTSSCCPATASRPRIGRERATNPLPARPDRRRRPPARSREGCDHEPVPPR